MTSSKRCPWCGEDPLYVAYHDREWGVPVRDEERLFEALSLSGAQAGLSWLTILKRRDTYRKAFDNFNPEKIVRYRPSRFDRLMADAGIIRNRAKIRSVMDNARAVLKVRKEEGSFSRYLWSFVGDKPVQNRWKSMKQLPAVSAASEAMSRDLKKRGFSFCGPTICYAFMQAVGMVNDHLIDCPRRRQVAKKK